jgi:Co/Zn/Cd efflux system component
MAPATRGSRDDAHTPLWRRITALFTLGSLVVLISAIVAVIIASTALLALFVLERAIAG